MTPDINLRDHLLEQFSAKAQTYYADTVAGPMTDRPREFSRPTPPAPTFCV